LEGLRGRAIRKGKPFERRGRKATGPHALCGRVAGLPKMAEKIRGAFTVAIREWAQHFGFDIWISTQPSNELTSFNPPNQITPFVEVM